MRNPFRFKSIYVKFTVIFLSIWWLLNTMTFGMVFHAMSDIRLSGLAAEIAPLTEDFKKMRGMTSLAFLGIACLGTVIILLVVRGIVKPIKQLSAAAKQVAKGDFEVRVQTGSVDEVGRLTGDFNTMVKELKSIDALRRELVSNVSHEIRTPITSIKGFAELIRDGDLPVEQRVEFSNIIVSESMRLMDLSTNMLKLSELDSQVIREEPVRFPLDEQVRKTILLLEPFWTAKRIEFDLNLDEILYIGNKDLLFQVWLNLIQNAVKFSNDGGMVRVSLRKADGRIIFTVSDSGIGIAEEDKGRIFDRFYRGDKARMKDGNGLGLVIVKKIVDLAGGRIHFISEQNKGTEFTVELPDAQGA